MKRSEMLDEIQKLIHEHRRATKSITSDQLGEMVLNKIEELGMVPTQDMYVPYTSDQQLKLIMKAFSWEEESDELTDKEYMNRYGFND